MHIEPIKHTELEEVKTLLLENNLPIDDIEDAGIKLFVAKVKNNIIGVIGLEQYGSSALLRSLAIKERHKNKKYGRDLINYLLEYCINNKIQDLYLLTTTAEKYFKKLDFSRIKRENTPVAIKKTKEFSDICPTTAVIMKKSLTS